MSFKRFWGLFFKIRRNFRIIRENRFRRFDTQNQRPEKPKTVYPKKSPARGKKKNIRQTNTFFQKNRYFWSYKSYFFSSYRYLWHQKLLLLNIYFDLANWPVVYKLILKNIFHMWLFSNQPEILAKHTLDVAFEYSIKRCLGFLASASKIFTKLSLGTAISSKSAGCWYCVTLYV